MKKLYTLLFVSLFVPAAAFAQSSQGETVYSLFSQYNQAEASKLSERVKNWPVKNVKRKKAYLSFTIHGLPFIYKWIGKKGVALKLNGHKITFTQLKNQSLLKKRIRQLLLPSTKKRSFSLMDLFIPKAHAIVISDSLFVELVKGYKSSNTNGAFWSGLFNGNDFSSEIGSLTSFLGDNMNMFSGNPALDAGKGPADLKFASPRTIYTAPNVGNITVK